jgi:hypothetical protein
MNAIPCSRSFCAYLFVRNKARGDAPVKARKEMAVPMPTPSNQWAKDLGNRLHFTRKAMQLCDRL